MIYGGLFDLARKEEQIRAIDHEANDAAFWNNVERAQKMQKERAQYLESLTIWHAAKQSVESVLELVPLAQGDESMLSDIAAMAAEAQTQVAAMEFKRMLSGEMDSHDAIVNINSGAGGTESCDWVSMLFRMYLRWAEKHQFKIETLDLQPGDEAGIKSVTFAVQGAYAYGYLKAETGVHRLVRISPFDSNARRHTSFASLFVSANIDDDIEIDINLADIKTDTYRAGGAGGQHVNKTDSAVRLTHIPSGVVVACQTDRSQHQNRAKAMKMLRARLYEIERQKREAELDKVNQTKKAIEWGSQIRSYVLQPYRLVKDHRTGHQSGNTDAVLDGELDGFIEAFLLARGGQGFLEEGGAMDEI